MKNEKRIMPFWAKATLISILITLVAIFTGSALAWGVKVATIICAFLIGIPGIIISILCICAWMDDI